jgi:hypothetical protein
MIQIETRELMEEIFPLTDQVNLLSETSRYAFDNLLASHFIDYGTKSNAKLSNSNITNTNNTCNNVTCSPLLSKKRQQSQPSFSRQSAQGMEHSGISKIYETNKQKNHDLNHTKNEQKLEQNEFLSTNLCLFYSDHSLTYHLTNSY